MPDYQKKSLIKEKILMAITEGTAGYIF